MPELDKPENPTPWFVARQLLAGSAASMSVRTLDAPLERAKLILQTQQRARPQSFSGVLDVLMRLPLEQGGILALWRGNLANCLRSIPSHAIRLTLVPHFQTLTAASIGVAPHELPLLGHMMSAGVSGATAMLLTYPLDLARTQMSADTSRTHSSLAAVLRVNWGIGGFRGLYRGLGVGLCEIAPYTAIGIGGYEFLKQHVGPQGALVSLACGWVSGLIGKWPPVFPFVLSALPPLFFLLQRR